MNKKAFTLIEILIILLITGMVISLAVPALSKSAKKELKSTASKIATFLSYVQEMSLIKGKVYRLDIDIAKKTLTLNIKNSDNFVETDKKQELSNKLKIDKVMCPEEVLYKGICSVFFLPNATNTGVTLFLKARKIDKFLYKVELNRLTGKSNVMAITTKE